MDCGLPGSSVHGIFQAGALEWVPSSALTATPNPSLLLVSVWLVYSQFFFFLYKEPACQCRFNPGLGRPPGGRHGSPLQHSCLEPAAHHCLLGGHGLQGRQDRAAAFPRPLLVHAQVQGPVLIHLHVRVLRDRMQAAGLTEVIPFTRISAVWGQGCSLVCLQE